MTSIIDFLKENAKLRPENTFSITEEEYFKKNAKIDYKSFREHYYFLILNISEKYKAYVEDDLEEAAAISLAVLIEETRNYTFHYKCFGNYLKLILRHTFGRICKKNNKEIIESNILELDEYFSEKQHEYAFSMAPEDIDLENTDLFLRLNKLIQKSLDFKDNKVMRKRIPFIRQVYGAMIANPDLDFNKLLSDYSKSSGICRRTIYRWHKELSPWLRDIISDEV